MVIIHKILVFPFLTLEQQTTFSFCQSNRWSIRNQSFLKMDLRRSGFLFLRFELIIYGKLPVEYAYMAFWKESMINRLSNLINRNRSAAKISQVLCSNVYVQW